MIKLLLLPRVWADVPIWALPAGHLLLAFWWGRTVEGGLVYVPSFDRVSFLGTVAEENLEEPKSCEHLALLI